MVLYPGLSHTQVPRQSMCDDGVHTSNFAGIAKAGGVAVSVVLSGKYEDDSDEGEVV